MKKFIKRFLPEKVVLFYHYFLSVTATVLYGFPSKKMIIIGVTGTKGKTSVANFIWACLSSSDEGAGIISTANIRIGNKENLNKYHMTMPGGFVIQKLMAEMVKAGCKYCVVETTSEGIKQYRHVGVYYDIAVFTNLTPEHLPSHGGSFEEYKRMKGKMFAALSSHKKKMGGKEIEKCIVVNADSEHAGYFMAFKAGKKVTFGVFNKKADYFAENIKETSQGVEFDVLEGGREAEHFKIGIFGKFNVYNVLPAIAIGRFLGIGGASVKKGLKNLSVIPGRMEIIDEGQNFLTIVDYAHEKESITCVLESANNMKGQGGKVIILFGAEGGGRDKAKRPIMGELSAKMADYVVVSNVDPYEDDPKQILEDIACAAENGGKIRGENLFVIEDRRAGIKKAISLAGEGDVVLITGKGAEQSIMIGGKKNYWDDRVVVKEELKLL
jgi:UDP-N-acetylmuramoyl-L-alanyl-D-glutamate--2,6-diaminopimelate ligase